MHQSTNNDQQAQRPGTPKKYCWIELCRSLCDAVEIVEHTVTSPNPARSISILSRREAVGTVGIVHHRRCRRLDHHDRMSLEDHVVPAGRLIGRDRIGPSRVQDRNIRKYNLHDRFAESWERVVGTNFLIRNTIANQAKQIVPGEGRCMIQYTQRQLLDVFLKGGNSFRGQVSSMNRYERRVIVFFLFDIVYVRCFFFFFFTGIGSKLRVARLAQVHVFPADNEQRRRRCRNVPWYRLIRASSILGARRMIPVCLRCETNGVTYCFLFFFLFFTRVCCVFTEQVTMVLLYLCVYLVSHVIFLNETICLNVVISVPGARSSAPVLVAV